VQNDVRCIRRLWLRGTHVGGIGAPDGLLDAPLGPLAYRCDVVNGGPVTRATLQNAVERAITAPSPASIPASATCLRDLMRRCADR
jgi:hypothetical protein